MTSTTKTWDILIKNGLVIDGSGQLPNQEDVAIANGIIAARGKNLPQQEATEVIDANGQWVMPGLLDIHTHFDLEVELAPGLPEAVRHGTTTVVFSNCSLGLAFGAQRRNGEDPIVDCFARVENIPKPVLSKVVDQITWDDSQAYLDHFEQLPLGPNVVPMIPHSMLRCEVMGLKESVSRQPTEVELAKMEVLLEKGMREGYVGFSTDALPFHYLANDPHRQTKIPSQWATYKEMKRLTNVVRGHGRVWQATPPKDNPVQVLRNFLLTSGRLFGRALKITAVAALDISTNKNIAKLGLRLTRLLNSGLLKGHFRFQALAAPFKVYWDGPINPLAEEIDELRELNQPDLEDVAARRALLKDPDYQVRFRKMWMTGKEGFNLARLGRKLNLERMAFGRNLDEMHIADSAEECPIDAWRGETFQTVFERLQTWQANGTGHQSEDEAAAFAKFPANTDHEADFMLHIFAEYDIDLRWWTVTANRQPIKTRELLMNERVLPGFNDSGAHLTNMAFYDGNLRGLKIIQDMAISGSEEQLKHLAYHVKRLTREPADFFGVDAGRIDPGSRADVIIVDPQALASYDSDQHVKYLYREDFAHHQLVNRSDGVVRTTIINGHIAWDGNDFTEGFKQYTNRQATDSINMGRVLLDKQHGLSQTKEDNIALAA